MRTGTLLCEGLLPAGSILAFLRESLKRLARRHIAKKRRKQCKPRSKISVDLVLTD